MAPADLPVYDHELTLRSAGLSIAVDVLTVTQMLNAMRGTDVAAAKTNVAEGIAINAEVLRMSLRRINGERVQYTDLFGDELIRRLGRVRHFTVLADHVGRFYAPDRDEREAIKKSASIRVEGFSEIWTVTLPDGRKVEMAETGIGDMGDAIGEAEGKSKTKGAAALIAAIASAKSSIRSIDGDAVAAETLKGKEWDRRFTVKETRLLSHVYDLIHLGEGEFEVGEARPSDGTK